MSVPALCEIVVSHPVLVQEVANNSKGKKKSREHPYFDDFEKQKKKQRIHVLDDTSGLSSEGLLEQELQEIPSQEELKQFQQFLKAEYFHFQRLQKNSKKNKTDWQTTRLLKTLREQIKDIKQNTGKPKEILQAYRIHRVIKQHMQERLLKFEILADFFRKKYAKMGSQWKVESKGANYTFSTHVKGGVFPYQRCHSAISACYRLSYRNIEGKENSFLTDDCPNDLLSYKQGSFNIRRILNSTDILHASSNKVDGLVEEKLRPYADLYLEKVLNKEMLAQEASRNFSLQCKRVLRQLRSEQSLNLSRKICPKPSVAFQELLSSSYYSSGSMLAACKIKRVKSLEYDPCKSLGIEGLITPQNKKKNFFMPLCQKIGKLAKSLYRLFSE